MGSGHRNLATNLGISPAGSLAISRELHLKSVGSAISPADCNKIELGQWFPRIRRTLECFAETHGMPLHDHFVDLPIPESAPGKDRVVTIDSQLNGRFRYALISGAAVSVLGVRCSKNVFADVDAFFRHLRCRQSNPNKIIKKKYVSNSDWESAETIPAVKCAEESDNGHTWSAKFQECCGESEHDNLCYDIEAFDHAATALQLEGESTEFDRHWLQLHGNNVSVVELNGQRLITSDCASTLLFKSTLVSLRQRMQGKEGKILQDQKDICNICNEGCPFKEPVDPQSLETCSEYPATREVCLQSFSASRVPMTT